MYYTYAYLRKEDNTPYYIGKGTGNRIYSTNRRIKPPKDKSRIIYLKQNLTEEEAFRHEIYMIAVFGRIDLGTGILHNRTDGGDGVSGAIFTEATRNRMSKSKIGDKNHFYGKIHSSQTKEKISNTKKGTIPHNKGKYIPDNEIGYSGRYMRDYKKGIRRINKNRKYVTPEGKDIIIVNLKEYCKEHNLTYQSMLKLHRGLLKHHKGYVKAS